MALATPAKTERNAALLDMWETVPHITKAEIGRRFDISPQCVAKLIKQELRRRRARNANMGS